MILSYSRILFLALFGGYILGCSLQSLSVGSWELALLDHTSFNFAYASACVSSIFLIPSPVSILAAIMTVMMTVLSVDAFSNLFAAWSLPVSALPFNLSVILTVHTLIYFNSKWRTLYFGRSPEESFEKIDSRVRRFGYPDVSIGVPFEGEWVVFQGFKGNSTHQGIWQYALDFIRPRTNTKVVGEGLGKASLELDNFPSFGAKVLAPCSGYIVALENLVADNPIGQLNELKNWGNFVMIRSDSGFHVSLCHLKKDSLEVQVGEYVAAGRVLAKCGNSGYSAEPHLHVQAQWQPYLNSPTIPFRIGAYIEGSSVKFHQTPVVSERISAIHHNRALDYAFSWPSGRTFIFQTKSRRGEIRNEQLTVTTDALTGRNCLKDANDNQLFFWQEASSFYFYDYKGSGRSLLAKIFAVAPRLPLSYSIELQFHDVHPPEIAWGFLLEIFAQLGRLFGLSSRPTGRYQIDTSGTKITGQVRYQGKLVNTSALIDPNHGIKWFKIANEEFTQVNQHEISAAS